SNAIPANMRTRTNESLAILIAPPKIAYHEGDQPVVSVVEGPVAPTAPALCSLVQLVDEAAFIDFAHKAIVHDVVDTHGRAGFTREGLLDLDFGSFPGHERYPIIKFGDNRIGRFKIGGIVLVAVFPD